MNDLIRAMLEGYDFIRAMKEGGEEFSGFLKKNALAILGAMHKA